MHRVSIEMAIENIASEKQKKASFCCNAVIVLYPNSCNCCVGKFYDLHGYNAELHAFGPRRIYRCHSIYNRNGRDWRKERVIYGDKGEGGLIHRNNEEQTGNRERVWEREKEK